MEHIRRQGVNTAVWNVDSNHDTLLRVFTSPVTASVEQMRQQKQPWIFCPKSAHVRPLGARCPFLGHRGCRAESGQLTSHVRCPGNSPSCMRSQTARSLRSATEPGMFGLWSCCAIRLFLLKMISRPCRRTWKKSPVQFSSTQSIQNVPPSSPPYAMHSLFQASVFFNVSVCDRYLLSSLILTNPPAVASTTAS